MKIVFLTRNYIPTICGVGDHTHLLSKEMIKVGHAISVICFDDQEPLEELGITVYPIIQKWDRVGVKKVLKVIREISPDWVINQYVPHGFQRQGLPINFISLYAALSKLKIPILTIFHEVKIRSGKNIKTTTQSFIQKIIAENLTRTSKHVVTSIELYKNYLLKYKHKVSVIPIPSNILPVEVSDLEKNKLKLMYNINNTDKIICTFGDRNISIYIPLFDELVRLFPDLIWLICGKNATPINILESRSYFRHSGKLPAEKIYQHLSLADIIFTPDEIKENGEGGTSNKSGALACALSLGIPIIGTKGDANSALLINQENIILSHYQKEHLLQAFESCLKDANFSIWLGKNALKLYNKNLTWETISNRFLEILNRDYEIQKTVIWLFNQPHPQI